MNRWFKSTSFHPRWILMSSEGRYAHLWARTKKLALFGHASRDVTASANEWSRAEAQWSARAGSGVSQVEKNTVVSP